MSGLVIHDHPSANFGERRGGVTPDLVVIHYTAMQTAEAALERLCAPEFEVSSHYLIDDRGRIFRLVDEAQRAWHAGAGQWGDVTDINSRSIGIELANCGSVPFAAAQLDALDALLADVLARYSIAPARVIAHADMAPERKVDPGPRFDWRRLARQGLSVWPDVPMLEAAEQASTADRSPLGVADEQAFVAALARFGYPQGARPQSLLGAFRDRFRPRHEGPLDHRDLALAETLAARFPVDGTSGST